MNAYRIAFESIEWQQIRPDVRQKVHCEGSRQVRLVEFEASEGPEHWCEVGHIGYVLAGALSISFDGEIVSFRSGDGLFIPPGTAVGGTFSSRMEAKDGSMGVDFARHVEARQRGK